MSLVAYENSSDESENEDVDENATFVIINSKTKNISLVPSEVPSTSLTPIPEPSSANLSKEITSTKSGLFSNLPTPKSDSIHFPIILQKTDVKDSTKFSKKHQPVKILIPSLSKLQDDDVNSNEYVPRKRIKPSEKGSTLFSILPSPKYAIPESFKRNLLPNVLKHKVPAKPTPPPMKKVKPNVKQESALKGKVNGEDSDSEEEDGDFFSLTKEDIQIVSEDPIDILAPLPEVIAKMDKNIEKPQNNIFYNEPSTSTEVHSPPVQSDSQELSDEAIAQLCGRRGKRMKEHMNIIDVNGDSLIPDSKEWLLKQLTEEQERRRVGRPDNSSRGSGGATSGAHRRKHQITYLAYQAKENEIELKNQWAQNRMSRKQTQSKYGF